MFRNVLKVCAASSDILDASYKICFDQIYFLLSNRLFTTGSIKETILKKRFNLNRFSGISTPRAILLHRLQRGENEMLILVF